MNLPRPAAPHRETGKFINEPSGPALGTVEFVALMAFSMSVFALSIDSMLPALAVIGQDLGVQWGNENQLVISLLILGMSIGQVFYGPLSDSIGRKPSIYFGLALFSIGCLVSALAASFTVMLVGRFLQGLGTAGPRIVIIALVRDKYDGAAMARIMSLVLTIHMTLIVFAPFMGQAVLLFAHWRIIFLLLLAMGLVVLGWFAIRQPETLPVIRRAKFSWRLITIALRETCSSRIALGYAISAGLSLGGLFGYVISARQIFQDLYAVGERFPFYFSFLGLAIAGAALLNSRLVGRFGMRAMCMGALLAQTALSCGLFAAVFTNSGNPPVWATMIYLAAVLFCLGIQFGNFNAMAMLPLGHIAGSAAGIVGSLSWFISMIVGTIIGQSFNGTILPLVAGFAILGLVSIGVMHWAEPKNRSPGGRSSPR